MESARQLCEGKIFQKLHPKNIYIPNRNHPEIFSLFSTALPGPRHPGREKAARRSDRPSEVIDTGSPTLAMTTQFETKM
jgi:hypothetical protein